MKVSLEGMISNVKSTMKKTDSNSSVYKYMLDELVNNLKWLKQERSVEAVDKFFDTYCLHD